MFGDVKKITTIHICAIRWLLSFQPNSSHSLHWIYYVHSFSMIFWDSIQLSSYRFVALWNWHRYHSYFVDFDRNCSFSHSWLHHLLAVCARHWWLIDYRKLQELPVIFLNKSNSYPLPIISTFEANSTNNIFPMLILQKLDVNMKIWSVHKAEEQTR